MSISVPGTVALIGAGEYLPPIMAVDKVLLERVGGRPRVVVLPTAAAPDGPGVAERWAQMGVEHFTQSGATVNPVMLLKRGMPTIAKSLTRSQRPTLSISLAVSPVIFLRHYKEQPPGKLS